MEELTENLIHTPILFIDDLSQKKLTTKYTRGFV